MKSSYSLEFLIQKPNYHLYMDTIDIKYINSSKGKNTGLIFVYKFNDEVINDTRFF